MNDSDLPQSQPTNHDRERLHSGISSLRGDDRHQCRGDRYRLDGALKETDDAGTHARRHEVQTEPWESPTDGAHR